MKVTWFLDRRSGGRLAIALPTIALVLAAVLAASCSISTEEAREDAQSNSERGAANAGERATDEVDSNAEAVEARAEAPEAADDIADAGDDHGGDLNARGPANESNVGESNDSDRAQDEPTPSPAAPNGRRAPLPATSAAEVTQQIITAERGLADAGASTDELAEFGQLQQVAYRILGRNDEWDDEVFAALPADVSRSAELHVAARRGLRGLSSGYDDAQVIPAWEIIDPEPPEALLSYYAEAEELTGIEWEYLAAINLLETGMGRIRGLSSAGAQGPMQFLPTTWDEVGVGDIDDPHDAIVAAGRYLVRRGGPDDMDAALWGYNNSDHYVDVVSTYAQLLREDPSAFTGIYNWEIWFWTAEGDVWLPVGTRHTESIPLDAFLAESPWSQPGR